MTKGQDEMGEIVDNCLGLVKTGKATPESVLDQVSVSSGRIRAQLEMALWLNAASGALDPRPDYVLASRRRLVERIQQEALGSRASRQASPPLLIRMFARWQLPERTHVFHFTLTLLLLILIFLVGQAVLLTSHSAFPGDAFYPVKAAQERVLLSVAQTETREAELRVRFVQRRLVEIEALMLESRYGRVPAAVMEYEQQVIEAVASLQDLITQDEPQSRVLAARLQAILIRQIEVVSAISAGTPPHIQQEVSRVLEISNQKLSDVKSLLARDAPMP